VLVTGSRDWTDVRIIEQALLPYFPATPGDPAPVLVHGACPTGADKIADVAARFGGWIADWNRHGKRAGFLRNQQMVDLGADVCLAFIKNGSKGASMTARIAEQAGIPVRRWEA